MVALNSDLIRDTQKFVTLYNKSPILKKIILDNLKRNRVTFLGRPLKTYFWVITSVVSPEFAGKYKKDFRLITETMGDPKEDFLVKLFKNPKEFLKINKAKEELAQEEQEELERIQKIEDPEERYKAFEKFSDKKQKKKDETGQAEKEEELSEQTDNKTEQPETDQNKSLEKQTETTAEIKKPPVLAYPEAADLTPSNFSDPTKLQPTLPTLRSLYKEPKLFLKQAAFQINKIITSPVVKETVSRVLIASKKLVSKHTKPSVGLFSAGVGAVTGFSFAGIPGAFAGGFLGGSVSSIIMRGSEGQQIIGDSSPIVEAMPETTTSGFSRVPRIAGRGRGLPISPSMARLALNFTPIGRGLSVAKYAIPAVIIIMVVIISPGGLDFLNSSAVLAPYEVAEGSGLPSQIGTPGTISSDISQCVFQRGDRNPKSEAYQSQVLLGYFQEVSQKTGVPAAVLAGIARVETPGSTRWNDAITRSGSDCPVSGDGAMGLMQIITPWSHRTDAYCKECVDQGASYFGKTAATLTREDFCNPKTNIFIGAGFILKKLQLQFKLGNGTTWDAAWTQNQDVIYKVAQSFYGCLKYGGSICEGPYNYGEDVWTSVNSCKVTSSPTLPPGSDYRAAIRQNFGIQFEGEEFNNFLVYAWEALNKANSKAPNFISLVRQSANEKNNKYIKVVADFATSETFNGRDPITINMNKAIGKSFGSPNIFKQILIHELGHVIHGTAGSQKGRPYDIGIAASQGVEGPLTRYSEFGPDESFSELVSYYILDDIFEQPTLDFARRPNQNPLSVRKADGSLQYQKHLEFIQSVLGGSSGVRIVTPVPTRPKVTLDPGHGSPDIYNEQKSDENALNLAIANSARSKLSQLGYDVAITRTNGEFDSAGYYQDLQSRIDLANQRGGIFVSIHFDKYSGQNSLKDIVMAYYKYNDSASQKLGSSISQAIAQTTNFKASSPQSSDTGQGPTARNYYLLIPAGSKTDCINGRVEGSQVPCNIYNVQRGLQIPGIIQEIFPNTSNYSTLNSQVNNIAKGYCQGILNYFSDSRQCQ